MITNVKRHYEQMLELTDPWIISNVDLDMEQLRLSIHVSTLPGTKLPCPVCGKLCSKKDHREERTWRHLGAMQFETIIHCRVPRINCPEHGVKSVKVPWADSYSRFTYLFEKFAIDILVCAKNITAAKKLLSLSWNQVHNIQKRAVQRGMDRRKDEDIMSIGIDEKNFHKGHSYISILNDLEKGRVLEVVEDRTEKSAKSLLNKLSENQKNNIKAVAMDMWLPYINATEEILFNADIVHDKFHISGYLGKAVDKVRKTENNAMNKAGEDTLKGTKYLWLTNPENLTKQAKRKFRQFELTKLKVGRAWSLKEGFKHFWSYNYEKPAIDFFNKWYFWATHSRLRPIIECAKTLKRHFNGIVAYLKHHITNAVSEGLNSKIQSIKASARGFRNFQNFRIAILFHCGKLNLYP